MNDFKEMIGMIDNMLTDVKSAQQALCGVILKLCGGVGGLLGHVNGESGSYDVESVYFDTDTAKPMVHADFPSFEADIEFDFLSVDEQNQVIKLMIHELEQEFN